MPTTDLISLLTLAMTLLFVPRGKAHITNTWITLRYYTIRAWYEFRYPRWQESTAVRAMLVLPMESI